MSANSRLLGMTAILACAAAAFAQTIDPRRALPVKVAAPDSSSVALAPSNLRLGLQRALEGTFTSAPVGLQSGKLATINTRGELRILSDDARTQAAGAPDVVHSSVISGATPVELANGDLVVAGLTGLEGVGPTGVRRFLLPGTFRNAAPIALRSGGFAVIRALDMAFYSARGELLRALPIVGTPVGGPWLDTTGTPLLIVRDRAQVSLLRLAEESLHIASFRPGAKDAIGAGNTVSIVYERSVIVFDTASRETRELGDLDSACASSDRSGASVMGVRQGRIVLITVETGSDPRPLDLGIAPTGDGGVPLFGCALLRHGGGTWFSMSTGRAGVITATTNRIQAVPENVCSIDSYPVAIVPWGGGDSTAALCAQGRVVRLLGN
jgi:hypothetical protein